MRHCLRRTKDKYHILSFLADFSKWDDCVLTLYQDEKMLIYSCLYPRGGNQDLWQLIHEKLGECSGTTSFVKFDLIAKL